MQAGFDMDLYLDWRRDGHPNGYNLLLRNTDTPMEHEGDSSYFNADSGASIASFLTEYLPDELSSDADEKTTRSGRRKRRARGKDG